MSKAQINGVLLLNKPLGLSSNTALQKVKRIFNAAKAGHTGTLDPLATGLLPICFGEATKFSSFLLDGDKEYIATIKLGQATTTYDAEGEITSSHPVNYSESEIQQCISSFIGVITQVPPIYSALKVNGKPLYKYARSGEEVAIKSREICIHEIEVEEYLAPDTIRIRVLSSKGTYIRSLAHDIGIKLGCGAHLTGLTRTKSNEFNLNQKLTLDDLANMDPLERDGLLLPIDIMVMHLPKYELSQDEFNLVKNGHTFVSQQDIKYEQLRLYCNDKFLGVAQVSENMIKPQRLINTSVF